MNVLAPVGPGDELFIGKVDDGHLFLFSCLAAGLSGRDLVEDRVQPCAGGMILAIPDIANEFLPS